MPKSEALTRAKKKYKQKTKTRTITFYLNEKDMELYEFSKTINFQSFVKWKLTEALFEKSYNEHFGKDEKNG